MPTDRQQIKDEFLLRCAGWLDGVLYTCYNSDLTLLYNLYAAALSDDTLKDIKNVTARYFGKSNSKNAGTFRERDGRYFVELNPYPYMRMQKLGVKEVEIDGFKVDSALDCALLVFEHELAHLIERVKFGRSGHSPRFKQLAEHYFGHDPKAAVGHTMPVISHSKLVVRDMTEIADIAAGDIVEFDYGGRTIRGRVARINKRATVIPSSEREDVKKFYVPLGLLRKVK